MGESYPYFMWHIIDRKHWPMMKVNSMFVDVATAMPAVLISAGWISAGTSQPRGPASQHPFYSDQQKWVRRWLLQLTA